MSNPALLALARRNLGGGDVHLGRSTTPYGPGPVFARSNASAYAEKKPGFDHSMHMKGDKKDSSPKNKRKKEDGDDSGSDSDDDGPTKKKSNPIHAKGSDADGDGKTGEGKGKKDFSDNNNNGRPDFMEKKKKKD